jgi:hypothetical protein
MRGLMTPIRNKFVPDAHNLAEATRPAVDTLRRGSQFPAESKLFILRTRLGRLRVTISRMYEKIFDR